eukprot:TRINITY_DN2290_c1_g2_i2.p1 TRINITY_DN2290_c1_g2~~TRINITY_DN2290_c1_g2_i2.p1  ORF type:complete len:183 (+),score=27.17 TRINITY_DN2290_c1_g2_i2:87-635(+)
MADNFSWPYALIITLIHLWFVCIIAPVAFFEGIFKSILYLIYGLIYLFVFIGIVPVNCCGFLCYRHSWFATKRMASGATFFIREAILFFLASITLSIPIFGIMFVFYTWDTEGNWKIEPILTILGWVDARRFDVIWNNCIGDRGYSRFPFPGTFEDTLPEVKSYYILREIEYTSFLDDYTEI